MGYMTKLKFAVDTKLSSSYGNSKGTGYLTGNSKTDFQQKRQRRGWNEKKIAVPVGHAVGRGESFRV